MDEKRLKSFEAYVHKKEAHELQREQQASREKVRRGQREQRYEKVREGFRRPINTKPPGESAYKRRIEEKEVSYDKRRESYAERQHRMATLLDSRIDRTKMVEYGLK